MLLDNGPETLLLYPTEDPAASATALTGAWVFPLSSLEPFAGLTLVTDYEVFCRTFPAGAWSKVTWNGRDWDVIGEPLRYGAPASVAHDVVRIHARTAETYTGWTVGT